MILKVIYYMWFIIIIAISIFKPVLFLGWGKNAFVIHLISLSFFILYFDSKIVKFCSMLSFVVGCYIFSLNPMTLCLMYLIIIKSYLIVQQATFLREVFILYSVIPWHSCFNYTWLLIICKHRISEILNIWNVYSSIFRY